MLSSFTKDEKKVIGFTIALMAGGLGIMQYTRPRPQPLFLDSYRSAKVDSVPAIAATTGTLANATTTEGSIDVNQASAEVLSSIPGVGPSLAGVIVAHRTSHGPFRNLEELDSVKGVGPAKLQTIRKYVRLSAGASASTETARTVASAGVMPAAPPKPVAQPGQLALHEQSPPPASVTPVPPQQQQPAAVVPPQPVSRADTQRAAPGQ